MDETMRQPDHSRSDRPSDPPATVFVPSDAARGRRHRLWWGIALAILGLLAVGSVVVMVYWPRLKSRPLDAVEKVAVAYLEALVHQDDATTRRLGTIEEPPAIASYGALQHDTGRDRTIRGSFAPLASLHRRIDGEFQYDAAAGRFTPKNALGIAGETLDALHAAKEEAEKSGMYEKMKSGDPDDLFDAAEQYGKVFENLAKATLAPKRILPTYKMLVESAKPPLSDDARALALAVGEDPKRWDALLGRSFWSLKPDGPFIYEQAVVTATARDRLASLGDPPSRLRLELVRFRLEGIDTGWRVVSARRLQPGEADPDEPRPPSSPGASGESLASPGRAPSAPGRAVPKATRPDF